MVSDAVLLPLGQLYLSEGLCWEGRSDSVWFGKWSGVITFICRAAKEEKEAKEASSVSATPKRTHSQDPLELDSR